jgi:hypothetical protein
MLAALALAPVIHAASCGGSETAPSPFAGAGGAGGQGGGGGAGGSGEGGGLDPTIGGPCSDDAQCNDGVACTFDHCDREIDHCRFVPDDSQCQNPIYCDGLERCVPQVGCAPGPPIGCSDADPCTVDGCDEKTKLCTHEPRDVDGDGDPDDHCGGGDCDDTDPAVSSLAAEVCGNARDDDCDGDTDEPDCAAPAHDGCLDPLVLDKPGNYVASTVAAALDYGASCAPSPAVARDIVAALAVPAGPTDVQLTARAQVDVALALFGQCGLPGSETACGKTYPHPEGGRVAKVRARGVTGPLTVPAYVFTAGGAEVTLRYELPPASSKPENETCGTATALAPGVPVVASLVDAAVDLASACAPATGELVYAFTLTEPKDVDLYASSTDADGRAVLSLRNAACALPGDEVACHLAPNAQASAHVFRHALAAGTYHVAVAASAPTDVALTLVLSAPTAAPADESCATAPVLAPNETLDVSLAKHQDDVALGCLAGAVDAVYALELAQASDVLLVGRYAQGDAAAVALLPASCAPADALACAVSSASPARARLRNLAAGSYRVVVESQNGLPIELTAFVRPAVPTTLVPFADGCADALAFPATGAFLQGTTANAKADFNAGCDQGGQPPGGAPDQLLTLALGAQKRVVLDMLGSGYATLLDVRTGAACPGTEVPKGCAAGFGPERSFLDLVLAAGTYRVQIDGFAGQTGPWFLDAHVVDP